MNAQAADVPAADSAGAKEKFLFWACFIALIATAFGFIVRTQIIDDWGREFSLSETQKGEILGVGLWPFAISIVLFSLIIDRIGYGKAMIFAFVCHVVSAIVTILAPTLSGSDSRKAYWILYVGTFIVALGNGTVEAVINPVVATVFSRAKTQWLNILHAGWPGGLVLGGVIALMMGDVSWKYKVALIFLPVIAYGVMMVFCKFPVNERVAAGVSYKEMLQQVGFIGAAIVVGLIVREVGRVFEWSLGLQLAVGGLLAVGYGLYVRSLGQPLFIFLLMVMIPLATTELGTDSWITDLMKPAMTQIGFNSGWVLVYTSLIMLILRFFAGPIVHKLSPLGLLATSAAIAACGLVFLSKAEGMMILAAATLYGFGKTFFWPTMLGVAAEQFPKGGALTLNTLGGVGMLAVGVIGSPLLGNLQDSRLDKRLESNHPALYAQVVGQPTKSVFGEYRPLEEAKVKALPEDQRELITTIQAEEKKNALLTVAIFPCVMFACYVALIFYFKSKGGYKAEMLVTERQEELMMTGGTVGPAEL